MSNKAGWYHSVESLETGDVRYFAEDPYLDDNTRWTGPFTSFAKARKDAISRHRYFIEETQVSIRILKAMKEPDHD